MRIKLSRAAIAKIKNTYLKEPHLTVFEIASITGFDRVHVRQVVETVQESQRRAKERKSRYTKHKKPQFIQEIEETTGLRATWVGEAGDSTEWLIISPEPKNSPLLYVVGTTDIVQLVRPVPKRLLQGISSSQEQLRKLSRKEKFDEDCIPDPDSGDE